MSQSPSDTQTQFFKGPLGEISNFNHMSTSNALLSTTKSNFHTQNTHPHQNKNVHKFHKQSTETKKEDLRVIKILPKQKRGQEEKVHEKQNHDHQSSIHPLETSNEHSLSKYHIVQDNIQRIDIDKTQRKIFLKKFTDNPRRFLTQKLGENQLTRLKVSRKSDLWKNTILTLLEGNSGESEIVIFERQFKLFGTKAIIKLNNVKSSQFAQQSEKPVNNQIGWIEGNFDGSIFNVYQSGSFGEFDKLVATINYANPTECMGGPRKVKIFINNRENISSHQNANLKAEFEANPNTQNIYLIESLSPQYNQQTKTYNICFKTNQPPKPSTHNVVFLNSLSKAGIKFYKVEDKQYLVQCFSSVTPLIALSYSFSSFVFKLSTQ